MVWGVWEPLKEGMVSLGKLRVVVMGGRYHFDGCW